MKPSILHIANYYPQAGGISAGVENLARGLAREGYRTRIHPVGGPIPRRPARYARLLCIARDFDLIHAHGCANVGFFPIVAGAIAARLWHKPLVIEYNDWTTTKAFATRNPMVGFAAATAAAIVTPCEATARFFRDYGKPVVVVPRVMEPDRWPFKERQAFRPSFICTRNYYDPELALEAFLILLHVYPDATLLMCGKGHVENRAPRLTVLTHIPRKYLYGILSQADIYLNTFPADSFGYSVHEAMAAGLAVVSVPSPALEAQPGPQAIIFSNDPTPQALARAMARAVYSQADTHRKVHAGREAVEKLRWEVVFPLWSNVYQRAMSSPPNR